MSQLMQFELFSRLDKEDFILHALKGRETPCKISEFRLNCFSITPDVALNTVLDKQDSSCK